MSHPLATGYKDITKDLKDVNPIGRIVFGAILMVVGLAWLYGCVQIRLPLLILAIGPMLAAAGVYGIITGMKDIPDERRWSQIVTLSYSTSELLYIRELLDAADEVLEPALDNAALTDFRGRALLIRRAIDPLIARDDDRPIDISQSAQKWTE